MMNCETAGTYYDLYLDGELAVEEMRAVELHLGSCGRCAAAIGRERLFRQRFVDEMLKLKAPRMLADNIRVAIDSRRKSFPVRSIAMAASVLVVSGVGLGVYASLTRPDLDIDETPFRAVVAHAESSDSEVYGSRQRVEGFLKARAPFATEVPVEDNDHVRLIGARLTSLGQRPAIVYMYDVDGRRVSVAQYHQEPGTPARNGSLKIENQGGFTVVTYPRGDIVHTVVGEGSRDTVRQFIPASYSF